MAGDYVVRRSELINSVEEARNYYRDRLAGAHPVECYGRQISLYFPSGFTHVFTVALDKAVGPVVPVQQRLKGGQVERRALSIDRARLMDQIIPAIKHFTVSLPDRGGTGRRRLFGPRLADGRYLAVVLRQGRTFQQWECVTAFPVSVDVWMGARRANTAKFPH